MSLLKSLVTKLATFLALHGGWGLFAISFLDSSVLSFPLVNDLLLIHLSSQHPKKAVIYAFLCAVGSVLGSYLVYALARRGATLAWGEASPDEMGRVQKWVARNGFVALLVASLLPPPAPFKLFPVAAGAMRMNPARFGAALLIGRSVRFLAGAWLGARYGAAGEDYLKKNVLWTLPALGGVIVLGVFVYRRLVRRNSKTETRNSKLETRN